MMKVLHKKSNQLLEAFIGTIEKDDWESIKNSDEFEFNWKSEVSNLTFKICLKNNSEIVGLLSIEDIAKESRIHIHLIESSNSNKGRAKEFDFIAGCLIAYTCQMAFEKDYDGFVSLKPKSELINHYKNKYGFKEMGKYLYTELANSEFLIKKYLD